MEATSILDFLDHISDKERNILVRLPYRVGLYVSEADSSGGDAADQQEKQTLANIINGFASDIFGAEATQHVISATVKAQISWPEWEETLEAVPSEARHAIHVMKQHVGEKEARAFGLQMYDIAEAVAMAFTEVEYLQTYQQRLAASLRYFKARYFDGVDQSYDVFISISLREREALKALADALDVH